MAALEEMGEQALGPLRRAAATSPDTRLRARARQVITTLEERLRQSAAFADSLLDVLEAVHDSSVTGVRREELVGYALRGLYHSRRREVPADLARHLGLVKELKEKDARALLRDAHVGLGPGKDRDEQVLLDRTVREVLSQIDRWAAWEYPGEIFYGVRFQGPGLRLGWDGRSQRVQVISPVKDGPAHRAGVHAGDVITHILQEGEDEDNPCRVQILSTRGWSAAQVAGKLLGEPGTKVRFTVRREGVSKPLDFEVVRARVEPETVLGHQRRRDDNWDYLIDPVDRIGYVRLTAFSRYTARDLRQVLGQLNRVGVKGLILDLRFNPGGLIDAGIKIANLFVQDGLLLSIRLSPGREARYEARPQNRLVRCPVVCLVNADTASISEVVAACLQDHRRALLVGERSRGKGGLQNILDLKSRRLTLTTGVMLRPGGQKLDRIRLPGHGVDEWGVTPDPGFDLPLPARDRAALRQHLDSLTVIPWRPPPRGDRPSFTDRQLALALGYLRARVR